MKVTIKDVARRAGVSISTVSRIINGKLDGAGEETRERVLRAMRELGYEPNYIARSMITKRTGTMGLIIPDIANPFFPEMARGVEDTANVTGMSVFLCNTDGNLEKERRAVTFLSQRSVDGFIATTPNREEDNSVFEKLYRKGIPVVFVERYTEGPSEIPGVYFENEEGARLAARHLIESGHRQIACLTGPLSTTNARQRLKGFLAECAKAGFEPPQEWILTGDYKIEGGYQAAKKLLDAHRGKFTAIFACNDLMAIGALRAAKEAGVKVPQDLALVGFDDITLAGMVEPALTSVEIPGYALGAKAAEMLIALIQGEQLPSNSHFFAPKLVVRESSLRKGG